MTSSQWLDMAVLAVAFVAAISGWRSGALGSLLSFIGVVLGAVAGVLLAPHIVTHFTGTRTQLFITLFLILGLVVVGEIAGVVLGRAVRGAIRNGTLRLFDSVIGVVVMVAGRRGGGVSACDPADIDQPAESGCRSAWFEGAQPGRLGRAAVAEGGTEPAQGAVGHLWPARCASSVRPHADRKCRRAGCGPDQRPVVATVRPSIAKIRGVAPGCQKVLEGTGFVVAPNRVMSNAHVVAGAETVSVEADGQTYDATVVSYDPDADISILDVPGLPSAPLPFAQEPAKSGTDALVLGYPGGGDFQATPARVRETIELKGPDIYKTKTVDREVYTIRGTVRQGNSGGPMVDRQGQVLGVVFGAAVDDAETGFVLTTREVGHQLGRIGNTTPVATGVCVNA